MYVIDLIVERMKKMEYNPWDFYYGCLYAGKVAEEIVWAFDEGRRQRFSFSVSRFSLRYWQCAMQIANVFHWILASTCVRTTVSPVRGELGCLS